MTIQVEIIDEQTDEVFTVVELDDDIVKMIEKKGMTVEEGINWMFSEMVKEHQKDPEAFTKLMENVSVAGRVS